MQNTYLYHVTREDHRHNFSIWFYQMYLGMDHKSPWMGLLAFVPQLALVTVIGIAFGKDIYFACFIQTYLFVSYNKVITSQVQQLIFATIFCYAYTKNSFLLVFYVVYMFIPTRFTLLKNSIQVEGPHFTDRMGCWTGIMVKFCISIRIFGSKHIFTTLDCWCCVLFD